MQTSTLKKSQIVPFDDNKAGDLMICIKTEIAKEYLDGTSVWLIQNHNQLVKDIDQAEKRLAATRLRGDMKTYKKELLAYKRLWLKACDLHRVRVEEIRIMRKDEAT